MRRHSNEAVPAPQATHVHQTHSTCLHKALVVLIVVVVIILIVIVLVVSVIIIIILVVVVVVVVVVVIEEPRIPFLAQHGRFTLAVCVPHVAVVLADGGLM